MSGSISNTQGSSPIQTSTLIDPNASLTGDTSTSMSTYLATMANAINQRFTEMMNMAKMMATGEFTTGLITKLAASGVKLDGIPIDQYITDKQNLVSGVVGGVTGQIDADVLMESPGTLFLLQQIMTKLKDAMAGLQAAGAQPGTVLNAANTSFTRGLG